MNIFQIQSLGTPKRPKRLQLCGRGGFISGFLFCTVMLPVAASEYLWHLHTTIHRFFFQQNMCGHHDESWWSNMAMENTTFSSMILPFKPPLSHLVGWFSSQPRPCFLDGFIG